MNYEKIADEFIEFLTKSLRRKKSTPTDYYVESINGEYAVLSELADHGTATPGSLSRALCRSTARIANTLKRLENKGLVLRKHDEKDRRKVMVLLTEKGRNFVKKKQEEMRSMTARLFESMGEHDAAEFLRLQKKAIAVFGIRRKAEE